MGGQAYVSGFEESVPFLAKLMSEQRYDGVLGFSQGGIVFRHFYRLTQVVEPGQWSFHMPRFLITVGTPVYTETKVKYRDMLLEHPDPEQFIDIPSLHMKGLKDPYLEKLSMERFFIKPAVVVEYDDGHKFPRKMEDSEFKKLHDFIKEQYTAVLECECPDLPFPTFDFPSTRN